MAFNLTDNQNTIVRQHCATTLNKEEDWCNMNLFIQEAEFRTIVSHYQSYIRHITAYREKSDVAAQ